MGREVQRHDILRRRQGGEGSQAVQLLSRLASSAVVLPVTEQGGHYSVLVTFVTSISSPLAGR